MTAPFVPPLRRPFGILALVLTAFGGPGCSKTSSPTPAVTNDDASPPLPSSAAAAASGVPAALSSSAPPLLPNVGLANRLQNESNTRPTGTPRAEDVYDALAKAGM